MMDTFKTDLMRVIDFLAQTKTLPGHVEDAIKRLRQHAADEAKNSTVHSLSAGNIDAGKPTARW